MLYFSQKCIKVYKYMQVVILKKLVRCIYEKWRNYILYVFYEKKKNNLIVENQ